MLRIWEGFGLWWSQGVLERYCLGNDWYLPYAVCPTLTEWRVGDVVFFPWIIYHIGIR